MLDAVFSSQEEKTTGFLQFAASTTRLAAAVRRSTALEDPRLDIKDFIMIFISLSLVKLPRT